MRTLANLGVVLALAAPCSAFAGHQSNLDGYYIPQSEFSFEPETALPFDFDENGDGYGIKAQFQVSSVFFIHGEYQAIDYGEDDDTGVLKDDLNTYRIGGGFFFSDSQPFFVKGEYIGVDLGDSDDGDEEIDEDYNGYGVHIGALGHVGDALNLTASIGYVDLDGTAGIEFLVGVGFQLTPLIGVFADYRNTDLELDDGGGDFKLTDVRTGVRFVF
ncbi:MAG: outer membrane beta-barrel protein [Sinimarinibacterium flocculans]|uniref:Outer membrane protein with beta-barrel domain n=1 Tax=Sinimarinibacterium flocculans TaxID=985250 RepID=A0A318ED90_9GAMM|nr:outer membrane beta-barrel protein [Sinimarinibacterium flocculans]MEC9362294.1 outer membrane beta-barrel protein [Pseudomonadota bacterium]PXV70473.1 outer membrane protein with beta-barrel domain [Sinimarinibacterium flocculans]HCZ47711.1 hypothetical protein [Gammaproteobacteria bacterium]MCH77149.1 hypothetical protein [Gammaproteobacteria bacterium]